MEVGPTVMLRSRLDRYYDNLSFIRRVQVNEVLEGSNPYIVPKSIKHPGISISRVISLHGKTRVRNPIGDQIQVKLRYSKSVSIMHISSLLVFIINLNPITYESSYT